MGTQRPAREDSITPEPLDLNEQSDDPGVRWMVSHTLEEKKKKRGIHLIPEMLDCESQEEQ
jgi:hypothetical protein